MSIRNLSYLFKPRSIAVIGVDDQPPPFGEALMRNLLNAGFRGPIMPVSPTRRAVEGVLAYANVEALPVTPELAVIASVPGSVPSLIDTLGRRGARAAVVTSSGFGEGGNPEGEALRRAMLQAAQPYMMRIVGPNCLGVLVPASGLNTSVAQVAPKAGHLAFVAHSGAVVATVLDWASGRHIGFSHFVALGDMADVDFGDLLDYLTGEIEVRAILLCMEAVSNARKFMSAARAASRLKPVIVLKAGRFRDSARAVFSHTGGLAGEDAVYDAAFRRAGMLRVADIAALFGSVEALATGRIPPGERLAIVTNGGGFGVMATDALIERGGRLAELSRETIAALDAILPPDWSRANPVDVLGDADGNRYRAALEVVLPDEQADAVLVLHCPTAVASSRDTGRAVAAAAKASKRCILTCWPGSESAEAARRVFAESRIPSYYTPDQAVSAFMDLVNFHRNQAILTETPASIPETFAPNTESVRAVLDRALADGREWLGEPEVRSILEAYGIPLVAARIASDAADASRSAAQFGGPVALKILSPDIRHKSDAEGVVLDLRSPAAVRQAAEAMAYRVSQRNPQARIDGFIVQPMVERPDAVELLVGATEDAQFGPVIVFGHGGTAAEIIADRALALPPLNMHLAREVMKRTRIYRLLEGYHGRPAVALDAVALTLIKVAQLVADFAEIRDLDINPLLADEYGVIALDARMRIAPALDSPDRRLAIHPYPKHLEQPVSLPDGRSFLLRPVLPEDEPAFQRLFQRLSAEDIRMRFFAPKKALTHPFAARLTQIDYDREMALVLAEPGAPGTCGIAGVVHLSADPDGECAEFAILLRTDMSGLGLGPMLMRRIIDYARQRGIGELFGEVLRENRPMLKLCDLLGFVRHAKEDDPGVIEVRLRRR